MKVLVECREILKLGGITELFALSKGLGRFFLQEVFSDALGNKISVQMQGRIESLDKEKEKEETHEENSGNKLLVKALKEEGVDTLFGYPGACTIDISDELYKQGDIKIILPRHEQALVHEADAYARSTGKVGVCLVTSGPGATNLVTGPCHGKL